MLERFLVDSSKLVTALAERRDDLASLVANANATTRALGNQKQALAESIELLPPFMRRANTTFVNLRAALDDVDPLVEASKPVAKLLGPFLDQARGFAADAEPTVADLQDGGPPPGHGQRPDRADQHARPAGATSRSTRASAPIDPGGVDVSVGETRGAIQETVDAFKAAAPVISLGRALQRRTSSAGSTTSPRRAAASTRSAPTRAAQIRLSEYLPVPFPGPVRAGREQALPGRGRGAGVRRVERAERGGAAALDCTEAHRATRNGR